MVPGLVAGQDRPRTQARSVLPLCDVNLCEGTFCTAPPGGNATTIESNGTVTIASSPPYMDYSESDEDSGDGSGSQLGICLSYSRDKQDSVSMAKTIATPGVKSHLDIVEGIYNPSTLKILRR